MTTFQDGPAKGKTLMLRRAPRFLRVVEKNGKFDALDQLDDKPEPGENLFAYEITGRPGMMHIHKRGGGGWYPIANYRFIEPQPTDAEMRTIEAWHSWCMKEDDRRPFVESAAYAQSAVKEGSGH
jgi:hypothetical protein